MTFVNTVPSKQAQHLQFTVLAALDSHSIVMRQHQTLMSCSLLIGMYCHSKTPPTVLMLYKQAPDTL
jgi:hypothetical protein